MKSFNKLKLNNRTIRVSLKESGTAKYFDKPSCEYSQACKRGDFLTFIILFIDPCFTTSASVDQQGSSSKSDESEFSGSWLELVTEFMEPDVVSMALTVPLFCGNVLLGS